MRRVVLLLAVILSGALLTTLPASAETEDEYFVPYNFIPFAVIAGTQENAEGTNDWGCKPNRRHPRPVVLVHGLMGNQATNWPTYGPLLANEGYCVFALTYGVPEGAPDTFGGLNRMQDSARELKAFVGKVLRRTGAKQVDLVGHISEGTLMPNWWVKFLGGADVVKRYVAIAPVWHGTQVASPATVGAMAIGADPDDMAPVCQSCGQFSPESRFMQKMRRGGVVVDGVEYTNIVTRYDQLVVPYTSGIQKGMRNVVVQDLCETDFSEHFEIVSDPVAAPVVLNALDPQNPRPVPCQVVGPFVGGPPA